MTRRSPSATSATSATTAASPDARAMLDSAISEKAFQAQIVRLARLSGFAVYHTFDARRSEPGFPDLVLVRPPDLLYVEVKREGGRLSAPQRYWLEMLAACGERCYCWRPSDWQAIERVLTAPQPTPYGNGTQPRLQPRRRTAKGAA